MATPHNEAKKGEIANVVLMPGDPNRAKWITETFLHDYKIVNTVRGQLCFTGLTANNVRISVMSSGIGSPSIGIYAHELYNEYDVDAIIRVGTCGSYQSYVNLRDVILCGGACTDSNWMSQYHLNGTFSAIADFDLLLEARDVANRRNMKFHIGNILAADVFYDHDKEIWKKWAALDVLGVEMESYALYVTAHEMHKKALTILTVTDNFVKEGRLTIEERVEGLKEMVQIAIDTAEKFAK